MNMNQPMVHAMLGTLGFVGAMQRGCVEIYSGAMPITADAAPTGTLLGRITSNGVAFTHEVAGSTVMTFTGASGALTSLSAFGMNILGNQGPVYMQIGDTLATFAKRVADAVNLCGVYRATATSNSVMLLTPSDTGSGHNGGEVLFSVAGGDLSAALSSSVIAGGVNGDGGLSWSAPSGGKVTKAGTWSFVGLANGTAGWFRMKSSEADTNQANAPFPRCDGSIGVGSGEMSLTNLSVVVGAPTTVDSFEVAFLTQ
jgi:hypothetical protein